MTPSYYFPECLSFDFCVFSEGLLKIRDSSFNTVLAPQFLLDCNTAQVGCIGGWPTDALCKYASFYDYV